ncbi:MAG TPA: hypothetical protein VLL77_11860 [Anaerolineales bacterium]|nr:hypothetical protein [Anaerolineales bacterium]
MLASYPFLLIIIGGWLAGCSAVLFRRAARTLGPWLEVPALAAAACAAAAFGWAIYWAWDLSPVPPPITLIASVSGWALTLAGGMLAGWGLRARGWKPRRAWRPERDELRQPYRTIRRPIVLGLSTVLIGLAILSGRPAVWLCAFAVLLAWNLILELWDWEQRHRLPACRDYMRRTARYLPFRRRRRRDPAVAPKAQS